MNSTLTMLCLKTWLSLMKTWLSLMKQQLRSKLNMNWNEEFGIDKDEKFWKTSVKDYPM